MFWHRRLIFRTIYYVLLCLIDKAYSWITAFPFKVKNINPPQDKKLPNCYRHSKRIDLWYSLDLGPFSKIMHF